jgi:predicted nucleic acid-binding protein
VIVPDASVIVTILLANPDSVRIRGRLFRSGGPFHVPHLIDLEVIQTLRRLCRAADMTLSRASQALDDFQAFPFIRYPHRLLAGRIWQLRHNLTAYDAVYLALAEALQATLYTCDSGLAEIARRTVSVELM